MSKPYAVKGTMNLLLSGAITVEQATETVDMWIELSARKGYKEGVLDGKRPGKKSHQAMCDMVPEREEKHAVSFHIMPGVHSGLTGEKEG